MAHNLATNAEGEVMMAWAGETPWHGLGQSVPADLTPEQMMQSAKLDWEVNKVPLFAEVNGKKVPTGKDALVRSSDDSVLDVVSGDWKPCQNAQAFGFFHDFVMAGNMEMHTAGALDDGRLVWALAKVKDSFTILGKDTVESYLLFTNPHKYGKTIDIRFTPIRVVCNNTLTLALGNKTDMVVNINHRLAFDGDAVKDVLGIAHNKMDTYKETAEFLASKRFKEEDASTYINTLFKMDRNDEMSRTGKMIRSIVETQPGAEFGEGSFWSLFNAVTFATDHVLGNKQETRLKSAWYGPNRKLKTDALNLAIDMAEAA